MLSSILKPRYVTHETLDNETLLSDKFREILHLLLTLCLLVNKTYDVFCALTCNRLALNHEDILIKQMLVRFSKESRLQSDKKNYYRQRTI